MNNFQSDPTQRYHTDFSEKSGESPRLKQAVGKEIARRMKARLLWSAVLGLVAVLFAWVVVFVQYSTKTDEITAQRASFKIAHEEEMAKLERTFTEQRAGLISRINQYNSGISP